MFDMHDGPLAADDAEGAAEDASDAEPGAAPSIEALYRDCFQPLCTLLMRKFGPGKLDAEDVVQGAFTQLLALGSLDGVINPKAFLYRTAFNLAHSQRRHAGVASRSASELLAFQELSSSAFGCPARVAEARCALAKVNSAVEKMEPRQRTALVLRATEDLTFAEIASRISVSQTRAKQLHTSAVEACARSVEGRRRALGGARGR